MSSAQKGRIILLITLLVLYEGTMALKQILEGRLENKKFASVSTSSQDNTF